MEVNTKAVERLGEYPPLLTLADGTPVTDAASWEKKRAEILEQAVGLQFGGMPPEPEFLEVKPSGKDEHGAAVYRVTTGRREKPISFSFSIALPEHPEGCPVILDLDVLGGLLNGDLPDAMRNMLEEMAAWHRSMVELVTGRGAAYVTIGMHELAPDGPCPRTEALYGVYPEGKFGALAAWAWGFHRTVDALIRLGLGDPEKIVFTGHSRGGKAALLAGATDSRARIVNPAGSGCGGMGMYRIHFYGFDEDSQRLGDFVQQPRSEQLADITGMFPYWFGRDLPDYSGKEDALPFDQHWLAALVAPRWLLTNEGTGDLWANPTGTLVTVREAKKAFALLGAEDHILARWRLGGHKHDRPDFESLLDLMDHVFNGKELPEDFQAIPEGLKANLV